MFYVLAHLDPYPTSESIVPVMKELMVKQLAVISGVTVRMLHHCDVIGFPKTGNCED